MTPPPFSGIGAIGLLLLGLVFLFIVVFLIQSIWNSTISDIFKIRQITLWEAFKILILSSILLGGSAPFHYSLSYTDGGKSTTYGLGSIKK